MTQLLAGAMDQAAKSTRFIKTNADGGLSCAYNSTVTMTAQADQVNKQFKLASGSTSLYGELTTNGGYTPSSGEVLKVRLHATAL